MKIVGYQIFLRITRFVILVIRPDYQIRHLGNPSGLPDILLKIDPCNAANHPAKAKSPMFDTDVGSNSQSAFALIGGEAHVLVLRMREAFHRWKLPALCLAEYRLPPLGNALTHMHDNCKIALKNPKCRGKNKEQHG